MLSFLDAGCNGVYPSFNLAGLSALHLLHHGYWLLFLSTLRTAQHPMFHKLSFYTMSYNTRPLPHEPNLVLGYITSNWVALAVSPLDSQGCVDRSGGYGSD